MANVPPNAERAPPNAEPDEIPESKTDARALFSYCWEQKVAGSNPTAPTNKIRRFLHYRHFKSSQKIALGRLWEDCNKALKKCPNAASRHRGPLKRPTW
jgi:hypothetical protein